MAETVSELFDENATKYAARVAVLDTSSGESFTYEELRNLVNHTAQNLREKGISGGDRVAILLPNSWQYVVGYLAILKVGAIAVLLNSRFVENEITFVLNDCSAKGVFVSDLYKEKLHGSFEALTTKEMFTGNRNPSSTEAVSKSSATSPANLLYTSGTTGKPKGVIQTHQNLLTNAKNNRELFSLNSDDIILIAAPFFHATALNSQLLGGISVGAKIVIQSAFQKDETLKLIEKENISFFAGVSTMLQLLLQIPNFDAKKVASLRLFVMGGSPVPSGFFEMTGKHFPHTEFGNVWGLTEATSIVTYGEGEQLRNHKDTVGVPVGDIQVSVFDEENHEYTDSPGIVGELCVRGSTVAAGYWNNEEATQATFKNGWLHTGDVGKFDGDGFIYVLDRLKDMIIRGGENVYSLEVENALSGYPGLQFVAVYARPDEIFGERVCAALVGQALGESDVPQLVDWAKERLADYKIPAEWLFLDDLPRNPNGKVLKQELAVQEGITYRPE